MMTDYHSIELLLVLIIILLAFVGIATAKSIIKTILFINVLQTGVILLFLGIVYSPELLPPIVPVPANLMVDPTPSALVITTIVIGASITALALMMANRIFFHYGTVNWLKIWERQGE